MPSRCLAARADTATVHLGPAHRDQNTGSNPAFSGNAPPQLAVTRKLLVHHGGAGTTHASLAAGTPMLICSVFGDQSFWEAQCQRLGVGATIPFARLDAGSLTHGLRAILDSQVADRAKEVAGRMADKDGIGAAVARLEQRLGSGPELSRGVSSAS